MATNTSANPLAAVEDGQPKRASFIGLPPELRLRIYGFLFSGDWIKEEKKAKEPEGKAVATGDEIGLHDQPGQYGDAGDGNEQVAGEGQEPDTEGEKDAATARNCDDGTRNEHHEHCCCSTIDADTGCDRIHPRALICTCSGRLHYAILSTNKLVYAEAMPVFYQNLEVRAYLPELRHVNSPAAVLENLPRRLPVHCHKYVTRIVFAQLLGDLGIEIDRDDEPEVGSLSPLWDKLKTAMPNIKYVRIHTDVDYVIDLDHFDYGEFEGMLLLPSLRALQIELSCPVYPTDADTDGYGCTIGDFQREFDKRIKDMVESLGKKVEVIIS